MSSTRARPTFLTGEWRYLAMLNFRIDASLVMPLVPSGTELDTWSGETLVSMVGFRFLNTRVFGVPIPLHRDFDEVNLRFYVRRCVGGEVRRGVTFVREVVPRWAIATLARAAYNEPYVACPTTHRAPGPPSVEEPGTVEYSWRFGGSWNALSVRAVGKPAALEPGSEAQFITEHYWGYTKQRDGGTVEYQVQHPSWRVWEGADGRLDCPAVGELYGPAFIEALSARPSSAFLAEGSAVTVGTPLRL